MILSLFYAATFDKQICLIILSYVKHSSVIIAMLHTAMLICALVYLCQYYPVIHDRQFVTTFMSTGEIYSSIFILILSRRCSWQVVHDSVHEHRGIVWADWELLGTVASLVARS